MTSNFFSSLATLLDNTTIHLAQISSDMNNFAIDVLKDPNFDPNEISKIKDFKVEDLELSFLKDLIKENIEKVKTNSQFETISQVTTISTGNDNDKIVSNRQQEETASNQPLNDSSNKEENRENQENTLTEFDTSTNESTGTKEKITEPENIVEENSENTITGETTAQEENIENASSHEITTKEEDKKDITPKQENNVQEKENKDVVAQPDTAAKTEEKTEASKKQDSSEDSDFFISLPLTQSTVSFPVTGIFERPPPPPSWPSKKNKFYEIIVEVHNFPNHEAIIRDFEQYLRDEMKKYEDPLSRESLKRIKKKSPIQIDTQELKDKIQLLICE